MSPNYKKPFIPLLVNLTRARRCILLRPVDQQQRLLYLIATFDLWDPGPAPPFVGPRVSDHGLLVLGP